MYIRSSSQINILLFIRFGSAVSVRSGIRIRIANEINQNKNSLGGGENIAPVPIEDMLRVELEPIISHVMVIGDKRKHLACVITLKTELDEGPEFSKCNLQLA